jgi:hypothetical protein
VMEGGEGGVGGSASGIRYLRFHPTTLPGGVQFPKKKSAIGKRA